MRIERAALGAARFCLNGMALWRQDRCRARGVDVQQPVRTGAGAGAAAPDLNAVAIRKRAGKGSQARINLPAMGFDLAVFVMVRTRKPSMEWAEVFRNHVAGIPEVVELHRIGGQWDYMLKIITSGMAGYNSVYRQLKTGAELDRVTGYFSMETILENRLPDLMQASFG